MSIEICFLKGFAQFSIPCFDEIGILLKRWTNVSRTRGRLLRVIKLIFHFRDDDEQEWIHFTSIFFRFEKSETSLFFLGILPEICLLDRSIMSWPVVPSSGKMFFVRIIFRRLYINERRRMRRRQGANDSKYR